MLRQSGLSEIGTLWGLAGLMALALILPGCGRHATEITAPAALHIVSLTASPETVIGDQPAVLTALVENPGGGLVTYSWSAYQGTVVSQGASARYDGTLCCTGSDWVVLEVRNQRDERDTKLIRITVQPSGE